MSFPTNATVGQIYNNSWIYEASGSWKKTRGVVEVVISSNVSGTHAVGESLIAIGRWRA